LYKYYYSTVAVFKGVLACHTIGETQNKGKQNNTFEEGEDKS